jgi:hypothetical protein
MMKIIGAGGNGLVGKKCRQAAAIGRDALARRVLKADISLLDSDRNLPLGATTINVGHRFSRRFQWKSTIDDRLDDS